MEVNHIRDLSFINFPNANSSVVYTQGCNFNCYYCYNTQCIPLCGGNISFELAEKRLFRSVNKINKVVVTGGEPTIHKEKLINFIKNLKRIGFEIKLDTNGSNPQVIEELINEDLLAFIAMDVKSPFTEKFFKITRVERQVFEDRIKESIEIIKNSGIPYEFRTVMIPEIKDIDLRKIRKLIGFDANTYNVHQYISESR